MKRSRQGKRRAVALESTIAHMSEALGYLRKTLHAGNSEQFRTEATTAAMSHLLKVLEELQAWRQPTKGGGQTKKRS